MKTLRGLLLALALPALTACGGSGDDPSLILPTAEYAVTATAAADFSSGGHTIVETLPPRDASGTLDPTGSDLTIAAHGEHFYRIERFGVDTITRYAANQPATPIWEFSTNDMGGNPANVYDMAFVSDGKAYLIRYGEDTAWIVNPSAGGEASFKTGELDLSAYADGDGVPEMSAAVIVGDRLFIAMQRFEDFATLQTAYVAVFDINSDTEIDTGQDTENGLMGIPLPVKNPHGISYDPDSGKIYLLAGGKLAFGESPAEYTGGIVSIDPDSYAVDMLVDDGDDADHPYGNFSTMAIVSSTQGYFIGYNAFQDNSLYRFNPSTGEVQATPVAGLDGMDLTTLGVDREAFLWVGKGGNNPGLIVLDTTTGTIDQEVGTQLNPQAIAFGEVPLLSADE